MTNVKIQSLDDKKRNACDLQKNVVITDIGVDEMHLGIVCWVF